MSRSNEDGQVYATTKMTETERDIMKTNQQDAYVNKLEEFDAESARLIHSYRTNIFGNRKEDSESMKTVKNTLRELYLNMHDPILFTTNTEQVRADFTTIIDAYKSSMEACEAYINSHKNPWTQEGKFRLAQVKQIYSLIKADQKAIPACAYRLYEQAKADPSQQIVWGNLLHEIRTTQLKVDLSSQQDIGGGTSHVYRFANDRTAAYFKQNEQSPPLENSKLYEKVRQDVTNEDPSMAEHAQKLHDWLNGNPNVMSSLPDLLAVLQRLQINNNVLLTEAQLATIFADQRGGELLQDIPANSVLRTPKGFALILRTAKSLPKIETMSYVCAKAKITENSPLAGRNVATSRIAKLLGLGSLVAEAHLANIQDTSSSTQLKGILMKEAQGRPFGSLASADAAEVGQIEYSPEAVHQLSNLHILDILCGQVDRNYGNYLAQYQTADGRTTINGITAIDNDMSFGLLHYDDLKHGCVELRSIEDPETHLCTLPCIDKDLYQRIFTLEQGEARFALQDILEPEEFAAFWERRDRLMTMLLRTEMYHDRKQDSKFMISANEWQEEYHRYRDIKNLSYVIPRFVPKRQEADPAE